MVLFKKRGGVNAVFDEIGEVQDGIAPRGVEDALARPTRLL
jgi:hypothetical protein